MAVGVALVGTAIGLAVEARRREPTVHSQADLDLAYARAYDAERRDPSWADAAEREFRAAIDVALPATSKVVSFECRAEFCRLELIHANVAVSNDFLAHLFAMRFDGPFSRTTGGFRAAANRPNGDGKLTCVVYVAKRGARLALSLAK